LLPLSLYAIIDMLSAHTPRGDEQRCCGCNTDFIRILMHWSHNPQCQHSHDSIVAYQQFHSLVGVLDNDLSSEEDNEEVRDPPENEGTVARHRRNHEANRNHIGALDNDLSTEGEDNEEEIIDLSDEVMEEQAIASRHKRTSVDRSERSTCWNPHSHLTSKC
jgi:hypothetical protein